MACSSREQTKYGYEDSRFEQNVDEHFHCSICCNVLKEPRTCRNNNHLFCLECITQHLRMNSQTCPECSEHLSLDTLRRPRLVSNYISKLKINCDFANRGCPEFVCVEDLNTHVTNCGFAPVLCTNENCGLEMNKQEREYHETVVCEYKKVTCHDCGKTKRDLAELRVKVEATNTEVKKNSVELKKTVGKLEKNVLEMIHKELETLICMQAVIQQTQQIQQKDVGEVKKEAEDIKKEVKDVKENLSIVNKDVGKMKMMITQLLEKFNNFDLLSKPPSPSTTIIQEKFNNFDLLNKPPPPSTTIVQEKFNNFEQLNKQPSPTTTILIAGGFGANRSAEIYSREEDAWFEISQMNEKHNKASSFIQNDQLFVVGGYNTRTTEFLDLRSFPLTWNHFPEELPYHCWGHQTVACQQRVFYIGGYNQDKREVSNEITELQLTPPFTMRELCKMTESRCYHGVEIIKDKVLILGGKKSFCRGYLASVEKFDPKKDKCEDMLPLPQPLSCMATVSWRDQVLVLGGLDRQGQTSNDVFMYDCKTGRTTALPSMLKKRYGCCAVITGDTIVVMGGYDERNQRLNSVEHFRMGSSTWKYLPAMNKERCFAVAEVLPSMRKYV